MRTGTTYEQASDHGKPEPDWKSPHVWALVPVLTMVVLGVTSVVLRKWQADDTAYNGPMIGGAVLGV